MEGGFKVKSEARRTVQKFNNNRGGGHLVEE